MNQQPASPSSLQEVKKNLIGIPEETALNNLVSCNGTRNIGSIFLNGQGS